MSSTTSKGIVYPTSGDNIAPLETVFATMASSVDTNFAAVASPTFTGTVTAPKIVGDIYASDGTTKVLDNGTGGSSATFTGLASNASKTTNISGGAAMSLPYQSAADTTAFLAAGTAGKVLQTNGTGSAPTWVTPVMQVFLDAAARTTAIPSPTEGMMTYLKDTNAVEIYDGSSWYSINIANSSYPNQVAIKSTVDTIVRPLPFAIHAGISPSITGAGSVTFPVPVSTRFTQPPVVTATVASTSSAATSCTIASVATTGFNIYFWSGTAAATVGRTAHYTAIQMTTAAAQG